MCATLDICHLLSQVPLWQSLRAAIPHLVTENAWPQGPPGHRGLRGRAQGQTQDCLTLELGLVQPNHSCALPVLSRALQALHSPSPVRLPLIPAPQGEGWGCISALPWPLYPHLPSPCSSWPMPIPATVEKQCPPPTHPPGLAPQPTPMQPLSLCPSRPQISTPSSDFFLMWFSFGGGGSLISSLTSAPERRTRPKSQRSKEF